MPSEGEPPRPAPGWQRGRELLAGPRATGKTTASGGPGTFGTGWRRATRAVPVEWDQALGARMCPIVRHFIAVAGSSYNSTVVDAGLASIRALFVEDDERLASMTTRYLELHGIQVTWTSDGRRGLVEALKGQHDVVILDVMLPGLSGIEVCRELRARCGTPVIMLTALGEEADRVLGLETGADDYLPKPFFSRELLARLRALVRRGRGTVGPPRELIRVGELELSPRDYGATLAGRPLKLTTAEFVLLRVLAERAGRVLTREQLLDLTKGSADEAFDRSIDAHISRLRHKLGDDPRQPRLLRTVRGAGYLLASGLEVTT